MLFRSVLWELSGANKDGLGHVRGEIHVVRVNDAVSGSRWAAIFGNGYNSNDHTAQLVIVPLEDKSNAIMVDTEVGDSTDPNGLGGVTPADLDGDGDADVVYGGDLEATCGALTSVRRNGRSGPIPATGAFFWTSRVPTANRSPSRPPQPSLGTRMRRLI